jgi:hypothetical protein
MRKILDNFFCRQVEPGTPDPDRVAVHPGIDFIKLFRQNSFSIICIWQMKFYLKVEVKIYLTVADTIVAFSGSKMRNLFT